MATQFTKIFHFKSLQNLPKWGFWFENIPSGNPAHYQVLLVDPFDVTLHDVTKAEAVVAVAAHVLPLHVAVQHRALGPILWNRFGGNLRAKPNLFIFSL
jgi:hypothetical protein